MILHGKAGYDIRHIPFDIRIDVAFRYGSLVDIDQATPARAETPVDSVTAEETLERTLPDGALVPVDKSHIGLQIIALDSYVIYSSPVHIGKACCNAGELHKPYFKAIHDCQRIDSKEESRIVVRLVRARG